MRHFEAGWGWEAQLRHLIRTKYRDDLAGLCGLNPEPLASLLGAELLPHRPYCTVQWVMRRMPFRPLELFLLFDSDPEFGSDLRLLFSRKSLAIPTEDAYVFAWDYLALLARYGRKSFSLEALAPAPEWLPFSDFAPPETGPLAEVSLAPRMDVLRQLPPEVVEVARRRLDSGVFHATADSWEIIWTLLGDLALRLRCDAAGLEVAFDRHGAKKYAPEFLLSFSWLHLNALLREARQVDPSLPRLSPYF